MYKGRTVAKNIKTSRRAAVKSIVGGVTVLVAYNVLPAKWGVPVVEQIFLPAHAATSGPIYYSFIGGPLWAGIEPDNDFMGMLADASEAVNNFIVSEAHADPGASGYNWYLMVAGDTITVSTRIGATCLTGTGPNTVGARLDLSSLYDIKILENTGDIIKLGLFFKPDSSMGTVTCTLSGSPAPTCSVVN